MARTMVEVLSDPLQLQRYYDFVADPGAGATSTFTGTTRDTFEGRTVVQLEYEAYEPMAKKALQGLCSQAYSKWNGTHWRHVHGQLMSSKPPYQSGKRSAMRVEKSGKRMQSQEVELDNDRGC
ncbi:hypothetical protein WJX84_008037 [Apatococcus fuscideae]|uniref:Uncharacterized protein n=1 Tax=Apatococcus fuscideae TaxID=2026836 RepID=A0AAW1SPA7_9CHLO